MSLPKRAFIYLPKKLFEMSPPGGGRFYLRLAEAFDAAGVPTEFRRRFSIHAAPEYAEEGVHFVHQGLVRQPGVFNTGIAYIAPFWYVDPKGVFGESSIADLQFRTESETAEEAAAFYARLVKRNVGRRLTKYPQPEASLDLPKGSIAVFLQGPSEPVKRAQLCSEAQMLARVVEASQGAPVLIKPHPRNYDAATLRQAERLAARNTNVQIVDAHVHDMLAAAQVSVSVSSSVSLEGFLHGVPAILFGRTDFHHIAQTIGPDDDVTAALKKAAASAPPFAAYLHWFLQKRCINMGRDDWFARICARVEAEG